MHVSPIRAASGRSGGSPTSTGAISLKGVARHVSGEGCQFVLIDNAPGVGQRLTFALACAPAISGVIRWVLGNRVGFAFDRPISDLAVAELTGYLAALQAIGLEETR